MKAYFIEELNDYISKSIDDGTLEDDYSTLHKMVKEEGFSSYLLQLLIKHNLNLKNNHLNICDEKSAFVHLGEYVVEKEVVVTKVETKYKRRWGCFTWGLFLLMGIILAFFVYMICENPSISYRMFNFMF